MDLSIVKHFIRDLPGDKGLALIEFKNRIEKCLSGDGNRTLSDTDCFYLAKTLERMMSQSEIGIDFAARSVDETWQDQINYLARQVENFEERYLESVLSKNIDDLLVSIGSEDNDGETRLTAEEKSSIHQNLNGVRASIEQSSLPLDKKNVLFKRLNDLASEVDRHGTKADGFLGLLVEVSFAARKFHQNLKPAIDDLQTALQTIYLRRSKSEGVALPRSEELPQLPPPDDVVRL